MMGISQDRDLHPSPRHRSASAITLSSRAAARVRQRFAHRGSASMTVPEHGARSFAPMTDAPAPTAPPAEPPDSPPRRPTHNQRLGHLGEEIAARWLTRKGWRIVYRRFRNGRRDIDLVAKRDELVAFVEVKARKGSEFGDPVEAVHHRKQRELTRSARVWIDRHGRAEESYRFDVVGVLLDGGRVLVKHVENAFSVDR